MTGRSLGWYARRLRAMDAREATHRAREAATRWIWSARVAKGRPPVARTLGDATPFQPIRGAVGWPVGGRAYDTTAADQILDGTVEQLGVGIRLVGAWLTDPLTGITAPASPAFGLNLTDRAVVGDVRQLWEQSRLQHLPVLAAAYNATGDERYAERCREHLLSWIRENPFLVGPNWTSGIELGLRLISLVWTRRLLDGWSKTPELFEANPDFVATVGNHLLWLSNFPSVGSSANNHAVAEAAGQYCAATAFPWFAQSAAWRRSAATFLDETVASLTFPSGVNSELASHYHLFTLELVLVALLEDRFASTSTLDERVSQNAVRMADAMAAMIDSAGRLPRQGDSDDAAVLLFDSTVSTPLRALRFATTLMDPVPWWPALPHDARQQLLGHSIQSLQHLRADSRPWFFADAGMAILRSDSVPAVAADARELKADRWLRFDFGPHGGTAIAAHAHADALSIELRLGGVDVIADAGTYRYGAAAARCYYRGTAAHSTIELDGADQSRTAGPFLWSSIARTDLCEHRVDDVGCSIIAAEHRGYADATHRRTLRTVAGLDWIELVDEVVATTDRSIVSRFLLGPQVDAELHGTVATLRVADQPQAVRIELPTAFEWSLVVGSPDGPAEGWYSSSYGRQQPVSVLVGRFVGARLSDAVTRITFEPTG